MIEPYNKTFQSLYSNHLPLGILCPNLVVTIFGKGWLAPA